MSATRTDIVKRYFDICNTALRLNKDRFPFKQILGAAAKRGMGERVEMRVARAAEDGFDPYVIYIQNDTVVSEPHGACKNCNCARQWNVEKRYLQSVLANPDLYIANPAKLDWSWMYDQKTV
ncbi:MAG: hypothetical protein ACPGRX_00125 [Bdellovibrionales bacterium]